MEDANSSTCTPDKSFPKTLHESPELSFTSVSEIVSLHINVNFKGPLAVWNFFDNCTFNIQTWGVRGKLSCSSFWSYFELAAPIRNNCEWRQWKYSLVLHAFLDFEPRRWTNTKLTNASRDENARLLIYLWRERVAIARDNSQFNYT